jgi:2'-5' RNA ligase
MRLFIATTFPAEILHELNERVSRLRPRLPPASWVREETQHLTLAFLGEQPQSIVEYLGTPLQSALKAVPRFEARLVGAGVFPNARHARVGWAGLEPHDAFAALATAVRDAVTRSGLTMEAGDFKPHLTLMRMREGWPPASIELFTRTLREYRSEPFTVGSVTLFSSQLNPKGAIHTAERLWELAP